MIGDVPPDFWKYYWLGWFAAFAVGEFIAIKHVGVEATLSYTIWWLLGIGRETVNVARWAFRLTFFVFFFWGLHHFWTGGNFFK